MARARRTLRTRIVTVFVGFAVIVTLTFGLSATIFVYTVEDQFFETQLAEEGTRLERAHVPGSAWDQPRARWMTVHTATASMPPDLRTQVAAAPARHEFSGTSGRHYHLRVLRDATSADATPRAWVVAEVSSQLVVRPMRYDLLRDWLAVMIVILAVAVALGLWLSRRIAQPLTTLAAHVRQLHPSRATPPLHIEHADREVELVSRALEELNERVHAFVQREQLFTRGASHELRTPLSVMRSATAQVLDDDTLQPPSRRLLTLAMHSAVRMERTVAILLTLTREDAVPHPEEPVRIRPVVEAVVLDAAAALDASGLTVHVEVADAATLPVAADVLHLLLSSLIGNAITHASRGPISVRAVADGISVSNPVDTTSVPSIATLGIPGVKSAASPGTGLGLALLHRLCTRAGLTVVWQVERGVFDVVVSTG